MWRPFAVKIVEYPNIYIARHIGISKRASGLYARQIWSEEKKNHKSSKFVYFRRWKMPKRKTGATRMENSCLSAAIEKHFTAFLSSAYCTTLITETAQSFIPAEWCKIARGTRCNAMNVRRLTFEVSGSLLPRDNLDINLRLRRRTMPLLSRAAR